MSAETFTHESPNPGDYDERLIAGVQWLARELREARTLKEQAIMLRDGYENESDFYQHYQKQVEEHDGKVAEFVDLIIEITGLTPEQLA